MKTAFKINSMPESLLLALWFLDICTRIPLTLFGLLLFAAFLGLVVIVVEIIIPIIILIILIVPFGFHAKVVFEGIGDTLINDGAS